MLPTPAGAACTTRYMALTLSTKRDGADKGDKYNPVRGDKGYCLWPKEYWTKPLPLAGGSHVPMPKNTQVKDGQLACHIEQWRCKELALADA